MTSTADRTVEELGGPSGVLVRIREGADDRTRPVQGGDSTRTRPGRRKGHRWLTRNAPPTPWGTGVSGRRVENRLAGHRHGLPR